MTTPHSFKKIFLSFMATPGMKAATGRVFLFCFLTILVCFSILTQQTALVGRCTSFCEQCKEWCYLVLFLFWQLWPKRRGRVVRHDGHASHLHYNHPDPHSSSHRTVGHKLSTHFTSMSFKTQGLLLAAKVQRLRLMWPNNNQSTNMKELSRTIPLGLGGKWGWGRV